MKRKRENSEKNAASKKETGANMGTLLFIVLVFFCYIGYLMGYCAGSRDKQKEMANKYSLIE